MLLCVPLATWGMDGDRSEPIQIEADRATLNEKDGTGTYEGNVQLRQGTLSLQGDSMTIYLANRQLDRVVLTGNPARMSQVRENQASARHSEADLIEYDASEERVILTGKARVWQDDEEEFRSTRIVFNLKDNTVNAGGKDAEDRVHITLQPKVKTGSNAEDQPR